jgi:hypothetical protein
MINKEYLNFFALGDVYEINHTIDVNKVIEYCNTVNFKDRGRGVFSLSLTSIDGTLETAIDGGLKYIDGLRDDGIRQPTIHYQNLMEHISLLRDFKDVICRTRIFKGGSGAVWEPHRDGTSVLRIVVPLKNCNWKNFRFMFEDRVLRLEEPRAYVINTIKDHAGVIFTDEAYILVMSVTPSTETAKILTRLLDIK